MIQSMPAFSGFQSRILKFQFGETSIGGIHRRLLIVRRHDGNPIAASRSWVSLQSFGGFSLFSKSAIASAVAREKDGS
jgi:hypothetical protein